MGVFHGLIVNVGTQILQQNIDNIIGDNYAKGLTFLLFDASNYFLDALFTSLLVGAPGKLLFH